MEKQMTVRQSKFAFLLWCGILALSGACTKEKGGVAKEEINFIPQKGYIYHYRLTEDGQSHNVTVRNLGVRDSVGLKVHRIAQVIEGMTLYTDMYVKDGYTVHVNHLPSSFYEVAKAIEDGVIASGGIYHGMDIVGYPSIMKVKNSFAVGSKVDFPGPHIEMNTRYSTKTLDEEWTLHRSYFTLVFEPENVLKVEQVKVGAGSFRCIHYAFTAFSEQAHYENGGMVEQNFFEEKNALWDAPGIGVVKKVSTTEEGETTLELLKITSN